MFRRFCFAFLTAATLAACAGVPGLSTIPAAPAAVAETTVLDEKAAIGAELAYQAFRTAAELAVDAGVLKGERAAAVARADNRAFAALGVARAAYDAGNASSYGSALAEARAAISGALAIIKGGAP
jgi:hypothetical protein